MDDDRRAATVGRTPEQWAAIDAHKVARECSPAHVGYLIADAQAAIARLTAENERLREENEKLRVDLERVETMNTCESCSAPLFDDDDFVSDPDGVCGCWHAMTDVTSKRDRPCFAYRVGRADFRAREGGQE